MFRLFSGIYLGWGLGANDAANVFGTGVATGVVRYGIAVWLTSLFVLIGALIEGPKCMGTLGELSFLIPIEAFCCTLAAGLTMAILTYAAIPASASHAIVGAVIGAGLLTGSADFSGLVKIIPCWVFTPVSGMLLAYLLHRIFGFVLDRMTISMTRRNFFYSAGIVVAGSYGAYSLGGNNVANVTGAYVGSGLLSPEAAALIGSLSIMTGVLTYSKKVMLTVGKAIVPLDPFSSLISVLAGAITLHLFTQVGVPVSSSQGSS